MPQRGKTGNGSGKVQATGVATRRGIDCKSVVSGIFENGIDQTRKSMPGANFDECVHPCCRHVSNLGDEIDRLLRDGAPAPLRASA